MLFKLFLFAAILAAPIISQSQTVKPNTLDSLLNVAKAYSKALDSKDKLAPIYLQLETLYKEKANYSKSAEYNFLAITLFEQMNNQQGIAKCYTRLCDLLYYENKYAEGADYCLKAIAIQSSLNAIDDQALSYRYLADNELMLEAYDKALSSINKAINLLKDAGKTEYDIIPYYNTRGNVYKYMERYEDAFAAYKNNYDVIKALNKPPSDLISSLGNIGHVYALQKKYDKALPYNLEAIEIMKASGNAKNLWENYMHVSDSYKALGNYEKALEYNLLYSKEYSNFLNSIIDRLESEAQIKYETDKKNETISSQDLKIAQQRKTQILYLTIAGLLAFSLLGMYFSIKSIRKKRKALQILNTELDSKNKQNELLLKEIHHRVKNNLEMVKSLIALQSAQLDDEASKEAMLASQNRVQSMGIIHQKLYQGDNLGSIEMKDYFINLSEGILDAYNAENKVKIDCVMEQLELDVDTAVPIGLIVNELLTNALKYAFPDKRAGEIKISLSKQNTNILTLMVADNGIGKEQGQAPQGTGFGSQLIELLTRQLNGKMNEDTLKGTSVSFQFKLQAA